MGQFVQGETPKSRSQTLCLEHFPLHHHTDCSHRENRRFDITLPNLLPLQRSSPLVCFHIDFYSYWELGNRSLSQIPHDLGQKAAHEEGVAVGTEGSGSMFSDLRGLLGVALWSGQGLGQQVHCAHGAVLGADLLGQLPLLLQCAGLLVGW